MWRKLNKLHIIIGTICFDKKSWGQRQQSSQSNQALQAMMNNIYYMQIQPFDGLWRVNLSFAYWNVKLYKIMVQLKGREKKITRGNSVSCFSDAYFPNQIESECSDWSWPVQRKVRNLTFTVELDRLRVIRTNFFLLKNITYLKFKRFQSIRQTRGS